MNAKDFRTIIQEEVPKIVAGPVRTIISQELDKKFKSIESRFLTIENRKVGF